MGSRCVMVRLAVATGATHAAASCRVWAGPIATAAGLLQALLPVASGVGAGESADEDPCTCLNWKQTYTSGRAVCGEAAELFEATGTVNNNLSFIEEYQRASAVNAFNLYQFCFGFYEQMDNNFCTNFVTHDQGSHNLTSAGVPEDASWCLVSSSCKDLGGGRVLDDQMLTEWDEASEQAVSRTVKRNLSWKICARDSDARLRDLPPSWVLSLSDSLRPRPVPTSVVTTRAYPRLSVETAIWGEVEDHWRDAAFKKMPEMLRDAIVKREPLLVEYEVMGGGSHAIVHGPRDVYHVFHPKEGKCPPGRIYCHHHEEIRGLLSWFDKREAEL